MTQAILKECEHEFKTTAKVLARVPDDRLSWTPHAKSYTMGQLALHIAQVPGMVAQALTSEIVPYQPGQAQATSAAQITETFAQGVAALEAALRKTDDATLDTVVRFTVGNQTAFEFHRGAVLRVLLCNHSYHHRGQLSVYLRLCDIPVPGVYGPSADEH